ncbi:MAG: hypothetical protein AB8F74_17445 [Saprospiraceae bacterium]
MNKLVKLKERETAATNSDFYNLFRPIAPSIDVIGKVAQVISGLTEAITIWYITQSEMAGASKVLSVLVSIFAMILVVALLELGGRKFLQVLTRALVWKRLKNAWYIGLFSIVTMITIGMGVLSFRLSTNGINHAFVSNVQVGAVFDDSALKAEYRSSVKEIHQRLNDDLQVIKSNQTEVSTARAAQYDAQIKAAQLKAMEYDEKLAQGHSWAKSQAQKFRKKVATLESEKASSLLALQSKHSKKLDQWQSQKSKAIATEKQSLQTAVDKGETAMMTRQESKFKNANFWGGLFSFFVGFSVILAFVCIISVEVYRRGAGIEVEYQEEEQDRSILAIFWNGMTSRFDAFFRSRAERFAQIPAGKRSYDGSSRIGFDYPVRAQGAEDFEA